MLPPHSLVTGELCTLFPSRLFAQLPVQCSEISQFALSQLAGQCARCGQNDAPCEIIGYRSLWRALQNGTKLFEEFRHRIDNSFVLIDLDRLGQHCIDIVEPIEIRVRFLQLFYRERIV